MIEYRQQEALAARQHGPSCGHNENAKRSKVPRLLIIPFGSGDDTW